MKPNPLKTPPFAPNKIKSIIFDFDGTLANSLSAPMGAYRYALDLVQKDIETDDEVRKYFGIGADKIFSQLILDPTQAETAFQHYLKYQREHQYRCEWHVGMEDLLQKILDEGVPTAIVTGRHSEDLGTVAQKLNLQKHFQHQICDNHLEKSKPHPEGIILAAEKLGLLPNEVIYVGDSKGDLLAAKAAGAIGVAALWDATAEKEMLRANADYAAETPAEVWSIFQSLR